MKSDPSEARVLVVADNADDAAQVAKGLADDFAQLRVSADIERAAEDFEAFEPQVLVLALDSVEKAQGCALALCRSSDGHGSPAHRSVLLCHKDEIEVAFELCRKRSFDDYVAYWPQAHDGLRLRMSVWNAARHAIESPREHEDAPAAPTSTGSSALDAKGRRTRPLLMIVEDDDFARKLIRKALEGQPWELAFAHDGASALGLLRRMRPDLILMDVNLPDVGGVALTQELKALPQLTTVPILMLTGDARRETLTRSVKAGAAGFIVKPFVRDALIAKLERFLVPGG